MKITLKIAQICLVLLTAALAPAQSLLPELGSIFDKPNGFPMSDYGAVLENGTTSLPQATIKAVYSRAIGFREADTTNLHFPYYALRTYEKQQVAAGKAPIFVTATYEGKRRPVIMITSLGLDSNRRPTKPSSWWEYVVNIGDPRFVNFWVTQYVRPVILNNMSGQQNVHIDLDNCTFYYPALGVLDDNDQFVSVKWDYPFPQNAQEYLNSVKAFFDRLKTYYPDVKVIPNMGTMNYPTQFPTVFANAPGVLTEDVYYWHSNPSSYVLNNTYTQTFTQFAWMGAHNRIGIVGAHVPDHNTAALITAFVFYELVKGPHFFFAARVSGTNYSVDPSQWERIRAKLGSPSSGYTSLLGSGYARLFSRKFAGGYVYLNWTGGTQTVTLPSGRWLNPSGYQVTKISIPRLTGTYVTAN